MRTIFAVAMLTFALLSTVAVAGPLEYGTDRPGSDIYAFWLPPNSPPQNCEGACYANPNCAAWTFVRTGWQGPFPRCYLKRPLPAAQNSPCCVSGVR